MDRRDQPAAARPARRHPRAASPSPYDPAIPAFSIASMNSFRALSAASARACASLPGRAVRCRWPPATTPRHRPRASPRPMNCAWKDLPSSLARTTPRRRLPGPRRQPRGLHAPGARLQPRHAAGDATPDLRDRPAPGQPHLLHQHAALRAARAVRAPRGPGAQAGQGHADLAVQGSQAPLPVRHAELAARPARLYLRILGGRPAHARAAQADR